MIILPLLGMQKLQTESWWVKMQKLQNESSNYKAHGVIEKTCYYRQLEGPFVILTIFNQKNTKFPKYFSK